jgi:hypothetical protein
MRQVELFRRDPSVGVLPPPSPPVAFFKQYWDLILGVGVPILGMAFVMAKNEPATTLSAGLISYNIASIVYTLYLRSERRLLAFIQGLLETDAATIDALRQVVELSSLTRKGTELQMKLTELERQKGPKEIPQRTGEAHPNHGT